jgi:hypothetical protein
MVRDMVMADGDISDEEVQESLGLLSVLAVGFAKVRKEYAAFTELSPETARQFLSQYESDAGLFGHINDATKWAGVDVCRQVEACCGDSQPINNLRHALVQWAEAIAASDETSESEEAVLYSIRGLMGVPASNQIDDSRESHTEGNVLTKEVAEEFLGNPDAVDLGGFTEIDEEAASVLCRHSGDLNLDGVTSLTPSVAAVISRFDGGMLSFGGLTTISREAAERLSSTVGSLHLYISEFDPDVQDILRGHPSLRIDDSRLESWLLERCGFDADNEGQAWIGEDLREALCAAADKYTCRDPESSDAWLMVDCYHPFDEGFSIVKQAGNREIHLVGLQDNRRHMLVFIGSLGAIQKRLENVVSQHE